MTYHGPTKTVDVRGGVAAVLRHGSGGTYEYENKFFAYTGDWENGRKHGRGRLRLGKDGSMIEGEFRHGEITGEGKRLLADSGKMYVGQFHLGHMHGEGVLTEQDGTVYDGSFAWNARHGHGRFTRSDGETYEGDWENDKRHGTGTLTSADGRRSYTGEWVEDLQHGFGVSKGRDGSTYEGGFERGKRSGDGRWVSMDGSVVIEGEWERGLPTQACAFARFALSDEAACAQNALYEKNRKKMKKPSKKKKKKKDAADDEGEAALIPVVQREEHKAAEEEVGQEEEEHEAGIVPETFPLTFEAGTPLQSLRLRGFARAGGPCSGEHGRRLRVSLVPGGSFAGGKTVCVGLGDDEIGLTVSVDTKEGDYALVVQDVSPIEPLLLCKPLRVPVHVLPASKKKQKKAK